MQKDEDDDKYRKCYHADEKGMGRQQSTDKIDDFC